MVHGIHCLGPGHVPRRFGHGSRCGRPWGIAHAVLPSSPQANNEPPPPPVAFCACPSVIADSPPRYSGYITVVSCSCEHACSSKQGQRLITFPCLLHTPASCLVVSLLPIRATASHSLRCQIYLSTVPQFTAALTMAAAARLLLRVLALLAAAQAVVGKSAVLSLRELDGRRGAATETRSRRYADAKLAQMLGTVLMHGDVPYRCFLSSV